MMLRLLFVPALVSTALLAGFALLALIAAGSGWELRYTLRGWSAWSVQSVDLDRKIAVTVIPESGINGPATVTPDHRVAVWSNGGFINLWTHPTTAAVNLGPGDRPVWSPDGRTLVYHDEGLIQSITRQDDGSFSDPRRLISFRLNDFGLWAEIDPIWSPDSASLALRVTYRNASRVIRGAEVIVLASTGGLQRNLGDESLTMAQIPAWSPDGERLAISLLENGERVIYLISANGMERERVLTFNFPVQSLAWSPDGAYLAFTAEPGGERGIYVLHLADNTLRGPLETPFGLSVRGPVVWSPDSTRLAFIASDRRGLYTIPIGGGLPVRVAHPDAYTEILTP